MLYAGISWSVAGYEVEVIGDDDRPVAAPASFAVARTPEMIAYLQGFGPGLVAVVDSTNGILDGRLSAAGVVVYRADPELLPQRPVIGSVPAEALARSARRDLPRLSELVLAGGTHSGRVAEMVAGIEASVADLDALTAAGRCLSHGPREGTEIALTFDDGPVPPYTGHVLDILDRYDVRATFFCVGMNASAYPDEVARIREGGHGLGNHTWSHPFLMELSQPQLAAQVERAGEAIAQSSGGAVPTLFRPPYGSRTPQVLDWLARSGSTVVLWDVLPDDWAMPGADTIRDRVVAGVEPGSIVVLHDGGGDRSQTVAALAPTIEGLLERGLSFVDIPRLLRPVGPSVDGQPDSVG
jgi:peptidoglycan/xylan/chitin deacetylase (PgdA/CDA1 family)